MGPAAPRSQDVYMCVCKPASKCVRLHKRLAFDCFVVMLQFADKAREKQRQKALKAKPKDSTPSVQQKSGSKQQQVRPRALYASQAGRDT